MGKSCRVKQSTKTYRKRKKVFCTKKIIDNVNSNENIDTENTNVNNPVNIVNTPLATPPRPIIHTPRNETVSQKKVKDIASTTPKTTEPVTGYRLVNLEILNTVIATLRCPDCCEQNLELKDNTARKKGLASFLYITCSKCDYINEFYTSTQQSDKSFDVNKRIVYAMRSCGQGYSGISTFSTLMDMPRPMTANNYDKIVKRYAKVSKTIADQTMTDAAEEIRSMVNDVTDDQVVDTSVSHDGTWQRRGHSSFNGCTTAISMESGKILDIEPMSRFCKACMLKEPLRTSDPAQYDTWKANHNCSYNYVGSANGMEVEGAKRIFGRSITKHKLRYTTLYGDGDSKAHDAVFDIYPGKPIQKLQCVGHVQKRVGNRLLNLKKTTKGLGGRGKLTKTIINRLQNYYGIAIRSNIGNLKAMQSATRATLFHVASSKANNYHSAYCPPGKDSWCRYQQDKANGTDNYKPGKGLPLQVIQKVKPIFADLSSEALLSGCLHGKTQNQNESFNGTVWDRLPKSKYSGLTQLRFGVYDAVSNFNIGRKASVLTFEKMGMVPGRYMLTGCNKTNKRRLYDSIYQDKESTKKRRKIIRGKKKQKDDKNEELEGTVYKAGEF